MRPALGLLLVSLASAAAAEPAPQAPPAAPPAPAAVAPASVTPSEAALAIHQVTQGLPASLPPGVTVQAVVEQLAATAPPSEPQLAPPAPVPVERATEPPPPQRLRLPPNAAQDVFRTQITRPPVIADEAAASAELLQWTDHLEAKQERRIERGAEVGGLSAVGIRLGGRAQVESLEAPAEILASLREWNEEGALVLSTVPGSPAEQAGLQPGDVVIQFAGIWIDSTNLLIRTASRAVVGQEVELWVLRAGEVERLWLTPIDRRDLEK